MGDHSRISFSGSVSTLDTFTRHDFSESDKDTAYYKDIVIYLTRNESKGTATLKLVAPPNRTQQPKQFDFSIEVTPPGTYFFKVRQPALPAKHSKQRSCIDHCPDTAAMVHPPLPRVLPFGRARFFVSHSALYRKFVHFTTPQRSGNLVKKQASYCSIQIKD